MKTWHGIGFIKVQKLRDLTSVQTNDIVVFKGLNNKMYVHRIIKLENNLFTTKGDNLPCSQTYEIDLPINRIKYKVLCSYPKW